MLTGMVIWIFVNDPGDRGSIPAEKVLYFLDITHSLMRGLKAFFFFFFFNFVRVKLPQTQILYWEHLP